MAPVYIHAKGAIVDDSWATIGSANLDGLSLDYNLLLSPLVFGETTACELNLNIIPPSPGRDHQVRPVHAAQAVAPSTSEFIEKEIRIPTDGSLKPGPDHDWLTQFWRPEAKRALEHVKKQRVRTCPASCWSIPKRTGAVSTRRANISRLWESKLKPSTKQ